MKNISKTTTRILFCIILIVAPPVILDAASVTISWLPNGEQDLAGYKIYYGTQSGIYSNIIDVGNVTSYEISNLADGTTYYFAVTAYDISGNESSYSEEVSCLVRDLQPPTVISASCQLIDRVKVVFSEPVEKNSAEIVTNYSIDKGVVVQSAELQQDNRSVYLYTTQHPAIDTYTITINNVRDRASVPNTIEPNTQVSYSWSGGDTTAPVITQVRLYQNDPNDFVVVQFNEPLDQGSALADTNYSISPFISIVSTGINRDFNTVFLTTGKHVQGVSYTLSVKNVKDGFGNSIDKNSKINYYCASQDTFPPTLMAVRVLSSTEIKLEFSESLNEASAENVSNYTITPSVSITSAVLQQDKMSVILQTEEHQAGTYTISVSGVGDDNASPNLIDLAQLQYTYVPPDNTPPKLIGANLTSDDLLELIFDEPIDPTSAEDKGNYSIDPYVSIKKAHLDVSQKKVLIETESHSEGNYRITVSGIKDQADPPNIIQSGSYLEYSYTPPDNTPPHVVKAELHGSDMVVIQFDESLDRASSENVSNYTIDPFVSISTASLVGDSLNRVYLETDDHQPGVTYTLSVSGISDRATVPNVISQPEKITYEYAIVDTIPPRLVSVELQGNSFLKLVFSESLDKSSAENKSNYTIDNGIEIEEATLDASMCKVFLKTTPHQPSVEYVVTVQGVTDVAQPANVIGSENSKHYVCESQDVVPPKLLRAELHGSTILELTFSEPLDKSTALNKDNYSIDNGIEILGLSISNSQQDVFLETTTHKPGTYTITVNNIKDLAEIPNIIAPETKKTYSYTPKDTLAPILISVKLLNSTMLELCFNEPLYRQSVEDTNNYSISGGVRVERAILNVDMTNIILQTTTHEPGEYTITINNIQDGSAARNTIAENTVATYIYEVEDRTPPTILSAVLSSEKKLVVTFSEPLDPTSVQTISNYAINKNIRILDVYPIPSEGKVTLETTPHAAGDYILTVNGIRDASTFKNTIEPYSQIEYSWSPVDTTSPSLVSANLISENYLNLTFSEPIDEVEANKVENYTITPYVEILNARLDANLMEVGLVTKSHRPGSYIITVKNIKDRAFNPNTISNNQAEYTYTPPDTSPPQIVSANLRTAMSLAIVFNEEISRESAENISNYVITPNIKVTDASLLASLNEVRLETTPHQPGVNYKIRISGIEDRAPVPNTISEAIEIEYTYTQPDTIRPEVISVKLQSSNLLEIYFSEAVEQLSAENRQNYKIDNSVEILNASLDTSKLNKVYLQTTDHLPGFEYQINIKNVKDRAPIPNTILPNTWISYTMPSSGGMSDNTSPQVAYVDVISPTKVDIVYSEPVDSASAVDLKNYSISGNVEIKSAVLDSSRVRVHLTTSQHQKGKSYSINVSGIKDCAPYPNVLTSATPVKYILGDGATLSNLSRADYRWREFHVGDSAYVDRDYTIKQIPEFLEGAIQILTANDDKSSTGDQFISFELRGNATIYVAYDMRIEKVPSWLSGWKVTGDQIVNSRSGVYWVYSKDVKSGRINLGANNGTIDDNMYLVFIIPRLSNDAVVSSISRESYRCEYVTVGDRYYIDRDYTVASIPEVLEGLLWIKTANDDKTNRDPDFLRVNLKWKSRVYIAYDSRIATLPKWLLSWKMEKKQIVDSRGNKFDILSKECDGGELVMGGNCGTSDDNMYFILIEPLEGGNLPNGNSNVPGYFVLNQNYPNPFNPTTTISYEILKAGDINITVYNILGQTIKVLVNEYKEPGTYEITWDGKDRNGYPVASGIYFYRIRSKDFARSRRMLLLR